MVGQHLGDATGRDVHDCRHYKYPDAAGAFPALLTLSAQLDLLKRLFKGRHYMAYQRAVFC